MVTVQKTSIITGYVNQMDIDVAPHAMEAWLEARERGVGECVQDAFPHLSVDEREFLISGVTPKEWDAFKDEAPEIMPAPDCWSCNAKDTGWDGFYNLKTGFFTCQECVDNGYVQ